MAVDTVEKRMAVADVGGPGSVGAYPGSTGTTLGRGAVAWNYIPTAYIPPTGGDGSGKVGLGQRVTFSDANELGGGSW